MIEHRARNKKVTEEDYYFENGFVVFTEQYLLKRGYCCESGCRHCPYGYARKDQPVESRPKDSNS
ncbi:MAG TPA: hypothetical protein DCE81_09095 [Cytophagales bacterium]|nr:hypothetical protein [Cytophagales bacterium]